MASPMEAEDSYSRLQAAYNELHDTIDNFVNHLKENVMTYIDDGAYADMDLKMSHFQDLVKEFDFYPNPDSEDLEELLVNLGDALAAEHHEKLGLIIDDIKAREEVIAQLVAKVRSCALEHFPAEVKDALDTPVGAGKNEQVVACSACCMDAM